MRAAVYHGPGDIRVEQVPKPEVGPRDVLLAVRAVGICGSDLHVYRKGVYNARSGWVMGHEFCGELVDAGDEVSGVRPGERFSGFTINPCGDCYWCSRGQPRLCPHLFEGYSGYGKPGAMAEFIRIENAVPGENLFPVPEGMADDMAAMAEPLGTAIYASYRAKPKDGDQVVVIGAGMIGNLVVQAFRALADVRIVVTETSASRREVARAVGADVVLDAGRADLFEAIRKETGPGAYAFGPSGMADIVIDAAAAPPTFAQALTFVRSKGTVCLLGLPEQPVTADVSLIVHKDIRVMGVFGSTIPDALRMLSTGKIDTGALISHRLPLDQAAEAFRIAASGAAGKVLLVPAA